VSVHVEDIGPGNGVCLYSVVVVYINHGGKS
jgi:hypothetical protein